MSKKQTGYSIYNEDTKRRTRQNALPDLYPELPNKKFDIIYADPPWDYNGKLQFDKTSKSVEKIDLSRNIFISSASFKYPTLKTSELMKIPVREIAKDDCLLFMWTSNPHLAQAIELGQAWGFEYKTVAFVWDKMSHNPGKYTLSNCELCLVFKRGRIPQPRGVRNIQQLVRSPRKAHSEKPIEVQQAIEKMFPTQERIELFARRKTKGWSAWGLDMIMKNNANNLVDSPQQAQVLEKAQGQSGYSFDYSKAKPNRFAGRISKERLVELLDPEVSEVFTPPESVNKVPRALVTALPESSKRKARHK